MKSTSGIALISNYTSFFAKYTVKTVASFKSWSQEPKLDPAKELQVATIE